MAFPTPAQEASTSLPVSVAYQAPPPVAADFLVGDTVQLLRESTDEPVETALGAVVAVGASSLTLGTRIFDAADGWQFALLDRPLVLPTTLCEINATVIDRGAIVLMGKGVVWMDTDGVPVPVSTITAFTAVV